MEKTLLKLRKLSRTVIYIPKFKIGPSTNYVVYTLTVKHIDVNITEAQSQRQTWKTTAMLRLLQNLCMSEKGKVFHVPDMTKGEGGLFQSLGTAVETPQGIALLHSRAGWEAWLDSQASQQCRPSSRCWFLFFSIQNLG